MQSVPHTRSATDRSASRRIDWARASRRRGAPRARRRAAASPGGTVLVRARGKKSRSGHCMFADRSHTPSTRVDRWAAVSEAKQAASRGPIEPTRHSWRVASAMLPAAGRLLARAAVRRNPPLLLCSRCAASSSAAANAGGWPRLRERLLALETTVVCDADKVNEAAHPTGLATLQCLDPAIYALNADADLKMVGLARTVSARDEEFLTVLHALCEAEPGEVLMIDAGDSKRAKCGEIFATAVSNRTAAPGRSACPSSLPHVVSSVVVLLAVVPTSLHQLRPCSRGSRESWLTALHGIQR